MTQFFPPLIVKTDSVNVIWSQETCVAENKLIPIIGENKKYHAKEGLLRGNKAAHDIC